jgi:V/A-type H+-transporting ATPase subunit C
MSDYDYLNARVRGMSTDLLGRDFYEQVLSAYTDTILMDALLGTAYSADVQKARELHGEAPVARTIESAIWSNASASFARLLSAAPAEPRRLLALQLNRWDVANVASLVRARQAGAEPHEALAATLPIGELREAQLAEIASEQSVEGLAEALTTWRHPFCFELRRALHERGDAGGARELERALYEAYFTWALAQLREDDPHQRMVRASIRRHIDQMNLVAILTSIRGRGGNGAHGASAGAAGGASAGVPGGAPGREGEPVQLFDRGMFGEKMLKELAACTTLEDAFEALADTYLADGVEKGILMYGQSQSLGAMERFLEAVSVEHSCRLFRQDMLGMAVPMGFLWRKYSECVNLRLLARGTIFRIPSAAIRQELVLV